MPMPKVTFPVLTQLDGELFIKHTYGNVRKFVKSILKLSSFDTGSSAYQRHLNKMWTTVDALETSFKLYKRCNSRAPRLQQLDGVNLAAQYQHDLDDHQKEITMLRVMLRSIDIVSCTAIERAQVNLLRYAIQDDGFYMPEAKVTIDNLLKECQ